MSEYKLKERVNVYTPQGQLVGYFSEPTIVEVHKDHFEISGFFYDSNGELVSKQGFNPEILPYEINVDLKNEGKSSKIGKVYVQRGRQPVLMSGMSASLCH